MVQDLVFGRKGRSKSVQSPAKRKGGEVGSGGGSGGWLKNRNAIAVIARSKGAGGGWNSASTHVPHYGSGSSIHSVHSRCVGVGASGVGGGDPRYVVTVS